MKNNATYLTLALLAGGVLAFGAMILNTAASVGLF